MKQQGMHIDCYTCGKRVRFRTGHARCVNCGATYVVTMDGMRLAISRVTKGRKPRSVKSKTALAHKNASRKQFNATLATLRNIVFVVIVLSVVVMWLAVNGG